MYKLPGAQQMEGVSFIAQSEFKCLRTGPGRRRQCEARALGRGRKNAIERSLGGS